MSNAMIKLLLSAGVLAGSAALMKPSEASFESYFKRKMKNKLTEHTGLPVFFNKLIAKGFKLVSRTYFKDYGVCRVAAVSIPDRDEPIYYLGCYGNWFEIPSIDFLEEESFFNNTE